ncbi:MAG: tryptophan--tRNA ligase [Pseudomonadota bacterium]
MKKRVLSGMQATGNPHLGNYLGAIKNWVEMQDEYECFYMLADLHAITIERPPVELHSSILQSIAAYLASGLDPDKATLFAQSTVPEHSELAWILSCFTPIGWLKRMTQFKDKAGKSQENAGTGLFTYPVLMAADILLYKADYVPVGEDQKQHIELTRDIAGVLNRKFGSEVLPVPEPFIKKEAARIMSLRDGTKKMSKSDISDQSRINLSDNADLISQKIKKAKTDSESYISYDRANRPDVSNLVDIYAALSGKTHDAVVELYDSRGFFEFKNDLADLAVTAISPITERYNEYMKDEEYLLKVIEKGGEKAREVARKTLKEVQILLGYPKL